MADILKRRAEDGGPILNIDEKVTLMLQKVGILFGRVSGQGTLYITTRRVIWLNENINAMSFSIIFPNILVHAISKDPAAFAMPCLYCQLDSGDESLLELRFIPNDHKKLEDIYARFCDSSELNPDPFGEEDAGDFFFNHDEVNANIQMESDLSYAMDESLQMKDAQSAFNSKPSTSEMDRCEEEDMSHATIDTQKTEDVFHLIEKKYRVKGVPKQSRKQRKIQTDGLDLTDVVDVDQCDTMVSRRFGISIMCINSSLRSKWTDRKFQFISPNCKVFSFMQAPGFYLIRNGLSVASQIQWAYTCLKHYSNAKYTNLTNLYGPQDDIWANACSSKDMSKLRPLRWSSLGYHYDWTERSYSPDNQSPHPPRLSAMADEFAEFVGYSLKSEASIINFYSNGASRMGGHVDDAELTKDHPIVSISLGNSAIFLLGGRTKSITPIPFLLRSGDVIVMGGSSRLAVHGVPRIIANTFPESTRNELSRLITTKEKANGLNNNNDQIKTKEEAEMLLQYLSTARININTRQVISSTHNFANRKATSENQMSMSMSMSMSMQD